MSKPDRVTANEWIRSFRDATRNSRKQETTTFDAMMSSMSGSEQNGIWRIKLDTSNLKGAEYDIVENAVRRAFKDKRTDHHPDAIFNGTEVEVKHKPRMFTSFPTDSYGLSDRTDKWYLFVMGSVDGTETNEFSAWLMRSRELFFEVMTRRGYLTPSVQTGDGVGKIYIDPNAPTAIEEIQSQIEDIKGALATSIVKKARGGVRGPNDPSMSLALPVGANRIRVEIKFESLLRKTISEILKD